MRELRQNASRYLEQVEAGETIEITSHGRPVARLVPPTPRDRTWADMIAEGIVTPGEGSILDAVPVKAPPGTPSTQEILDDLRADT